MSPIRIDSAAVNNNISSLAFTLNCSAGMFSGYLMMRDKELEYCSYYVSVGQLPNYLAIFIHAGNQVNAFRYITKIYLFYTAPVCVRGVYAH